LQENEVEGFVEFVTISMRTTTPDAQILFTTDGSLPTPAKAKRYDGPFKDIKAGRVKLNAIVLAPGKLPSPVSSCLVYDIIAKNPPPIIEPTGGTFVTEVVLHIFGVEGSGSIFITLDGSDPIAGASSHVAGPVTISKIGSVVVKAILTNPGRADSSIATANFMMLERVKTPVFGVDSGTFTDTVMLRLSCATDGARMRYTIDGQTPNAASPEYLSGIDLGLGRKGVEASYVVKAIAIAQNMGDSFVAVSGTIFVQPQVQAPGITPDSTGPFTPPLKVKISTSTPGAIIYFTTDGSVPSLDSPVYSNSMFLTPRQDGTDGIVVKAIAFAAHMSASPVAESAPYEFEAFKPVADPNGGHFDSSVQVKLTCATENAELRYTVDGSVPTSASALYSGEVVIGTTGVVLQAIATYPGLANSQVAKSKEFLIKAHAPEFSLDTGTFVGEAQIYVTCATPGAEVRCTLDGSVPTAQTPVCTSPVKITMTGTVVKAVATKDELGASQVAISLPVRIKAAPPTLEPNGGTFTEEGSFAMHCTQPDCKIYYSLDGSPPTLLYTGIIKVNQTGIVIKAFSAVAGNHRSDVVVSSTPVIIQAPVPKFIADGAMETDGAGAESEGGGAGAGGRGGLDTSSDDEPTKKEEDFAGTALIHLRSRIPGALVHYTLTGEDPTEGSPVYVRGHPIKLTKDGDVQIKAMVTIPGMSPSPVVTSNIFKILSCVVEPEIEPVSSGPFSGQVLVTLRPLTAGSQIYFSLDSSTPTKESNLYVVPFTINTLGTTTVKVIGTKEGFVDSPVASTSFLLLEQAKMPTFIPNFGTFIDNATVHMSCETEGAAIRYTIDGSEPNAGSSQYNPNDGITVGLSEEGKEKVYILKAVAMKDTLGNSQTAVSKTFVVQPQVATPTISPLIPGPYENRVQVTITSTTPHASIHFTTDGTEPSIESTLYADKGQPCPSVPSCRPVFTSTNSKVKAIAVAPQMAASVITESVEYEIEVADPTFQPDGGTFLNLATITITCTKPGALLYYTVDGTDPTRTSALYSGPFDQSHTDLVVKAIAFHPDLIESQVVSSAPFSIKASPPQITPDEGTFSGAALIHVTSPTHAAQMHCTFDGTDPTDETPVCISPVSVTKTGTLIKAVATKEGLTVSDVASMVSPIIIKARPPIITPNKGSFTNEVLVVMTCSEPGCTIHYVFGKESTPTEEVSEVTKLYTEPIVVTNTDTVIRAIAIAEGMALSDVSSTEPLGVFASAATFSANGTIWAQGVDNNEKKDFVEDAMISMETSTPDAVIVYTTDGSFPSVSYGSKYKGPIEDSAHGGKTLRAVVFAKNKRPSPFTESPIIDIIARTPMPRILGFGPPAFFSGSDEHFAGRNNNDHEADSESEAFSVAKNTSNDDDDDNDGLGNSEKGETNKEGDNHDNKDGRSSSFGLHGPYGGKVILALFPCRIDKYKELLIFGATQVIKLLLYFLL
jgi:hypothetical protein